MTDDPPGVAGVREVAAQAYGLDLSRYDESFLASLFERRRQAAGAASLQDYARTLAQNGAEAEALRGLLRVSYSEFFRDTLTYAYLERVVLPALVEARERRGCGEVRVWSAGCAAGQEAWSLAILLDAVTTALGREPAYRIFATDVSAAEVANARDGVYSQEALRNVRVAQLESCFSPRGNCYAVAERLRKHVELAVHDVLDPSTTSPPAAVYGDFDLIMCANVLLYYQPHAREQVLRKFKKSLAPHGIFVTGEAERQLIEQRGDFRAAAAPVAVFRHAEREK